MLMQLSIWKKEWDEDKKEYEPVDLSYQPYGYHLVTSRPHTQPAVPVCPRAHAATSATLL